MTSIREKKKKKADEFYKAIKDCPESPEFRDRLDWHNKRAAADGMKHVGYGIYFNKSDFLEALTPAERQTLEKAQEDPLAAVVLLTSKLSGDYDSSLLSSPSPEDYQGRRASSFLVGSAHGQLRGVCRHKTAILAEALRSFGVPAEDRWGIQVGGEQPVHHSWVDIPQLNKVADPTLGTVHDRSNYQVEHDVFHERPARCFVGATIK